MTSNLDTRTLHQIQLMATKLQHEPSYMAWIISTYLKQEKITSQKMLEILQANEETLAKLSLCKRPDSNSKDFYKQAKQIAEYTGIDLLKLVTIIRQTESVGVFSSKPQIDTEPVKGAMQIGFAAARDKTDENFDDQDSSTTGDKKDVADE